MYWYFRQVFIAFDRLCNTLLGGNAELTFSGRCWQEQIKAKTNARYYFWSALGTTIDFIFFWQCEYHCKESYEYDRKKWSG